MKHYRCPMGRRADYPHPAPERTAYRVGVRFDQDDYYQVWPNRASMARSIRMQERGDVIPSQKWHALVPLRETEGY